MVDIGIGCLPGALADTGQQAERGHFAEGDAAESEFAHVGARASGDEAAILESGRRAVAGQGLELELDVLLLARVVRLGQLLLERGAARLMFGVHFAPFEVSVNVRSSCHLVVQ